MRVPAASIAVLTPRYKRSRSKFADKVYSYYGKKEETTAQNEAGRYGNKNAEQVRSGWVAGKCKDERKRRKRWRRYAG